MTGGTESMSQAPYAVWNARFGTTLGMDLKVVRDLRGGEGRRGSEGDREKERGREDRDRKGERMRGREVFVNVHEFLPRWKTRYGPH